MKRLRLFRWVGLCLILALGNACQSSKSEEKATSSVTEERANLPTAAPPVGTPPVAMAPPPASPAQLRTLAQSFDPIIRGAWVTTGYLEAVQKSKSPLKAADAVGAVSEIHINPAARAGDSLVLTVGFGNHEGGNTTLYYRPGQQPNSLATRYRDYDSPGSYAELSYRLGPRDTTLLLTTYSRSRRALNRTAYRRVAGAQVGTLGALNRAVNQRLFVGSYTGVDSLGKPAAMQFAANGRLKGLKGFRTYTVNTDFSGGPGNDIDHLVLDPQTKHTRLMGYSHRADTLRLYAADTVEPQLVAGTEDEYTLPVLVRGRLLFTLVRRR
ncbi:hypothetical protein [Hymenobacter arizonensis]|uniref:Uncharacterized protein n=1 Tax=Hymenobacter arizonensis TaxID=1227077 RepID=A0A1I6AWF8_HYMAR|nr:hypothetical protein [Hymenobacter arizonensis]SFQ73051.1 hypothetical protein SAMN04515668_3972 [Hymenobacter arizonensis]